MSVKIDDIRRTMHAQFVQDFPNSKYSRHDSAKSGGVQYKSDEFWCSAGWGVLTYNQHEFMPSFSASIMYRELEDIVLPILRKHKLMGGKASDFVHRFPRLLPEKFSKPPYAFEDVLKVKSTDDIVPFADKFSLFFKDGAMPYFETCTDLDYVWSYVEKLNGRIENSDVMGPFWVFYRCALMKCCGIPGAEKLAIQFQEERRLIAEKHPDEEVALQYLDAANDLLEVICR